MSSPLADFCTDLLTYLTREVAAQREAQAPIRRLTGALIACDHPLIAAATADLGVWEQAHRPLRELADGLAASWEALGKGAPFTWSAILHGIRHTPEDVEYGWRIAALAGELKDLASTNHAQTELNSLLISQHAEVLHQTYLAIAQAVVGDQQAGAYAAHGGSAPTAGMAALLDARG
ncbi:MAG TPA: hypothetical protein VEI97_20515 [bacterium]|nr:hypothetical protein [bacterium]